MVVKCPECDGTYEFDAPASSHFKDGICCHCQRRRKYGSIHYEVTLRDTRNGYQRTLTDEFICSERGEDEDISTLNYLWEEGNYSCDCNRYGMLYEPDDENDSPPCGGDIIELVSLEIKTPSDSKPAGGP